MTQRIISFAVPCYNVAQYLDHCVQTILDAAEGILDKIEVILVDDGSNKDDTPALIDSWQERHPQVITAIHQPNGGHGQAVNTGLEHANGTYFKVVDADDWLDIKAAREMIDTLEGLIISGSVVDLMICNYVYEKVFEGKRNPIRYAGILPESRVFDWSEVGNFGNSQNLLMHSVTYRTELLRSAGLSLPEHTFYVDNIFVYVPLPHVQTLYYLNVDMYRYFIGREGQSVNEKTMIARIEQQLRVTRIMIDSVDLAGDVADERLREYMINYLAMMMTICSVFLLLSDRPDKLELKDDIWEYLQKHNPSVYDRIRKSALGRGSNLPTPLGRAMTKAGYRLAQKIYKFN